MGRMLLPFLAGLALAAALRAQSPPDPGRDADPLPRPKVGSPAKPDETPPDDEQLAREWMIAQRIARDRLTPEQTAKLQGEYAKLTAPQIRVLLQVYESTYGIPYPYHKPQEMSDPLEATREWIVAYRIVRDRLSVEQAKAFGEEVRNMTSSQIRILAMAYQQEATERQRKQSTRRPTTGSPQDPDTVLQLRQAEQRMQTQQEARQIALQQAQGVRGDVVAAQASIGRGAAAAAQNANMRYEQNRQFSEQQILNAPEGSRYRHAYWGW